MVDMVAIATITIEMEKATAVVKFTFSITLRSLLRISEIYDETLKLLKMAEKAVVCIC